MRWRSRLRISAKAAAQYALALERFAGSPPMLDLVHLGLGPNGYTASLVPGDPVLQIAEADVGVTGAYQGRQRVTLTYITKVETTEQRTDVFGE